MLFVYRMLFGSSHPTQDLSWKKDVDDGDEYKWMIVILTIYLIKHMAIMPTVQIKFYSEISFKIEICISLNMNLTMSTLATVDYVIDIYARFHQLELNIA